MPPKDKTYSLDDIDAVTNGGVYGDVDLTKTENVLKYAKTGELPKIVKSQEQRKVKEQVSGVKQTYSMDDINKVTGVTEEAPVESVKHPYEGWTWSKENLKPRVQTPDLFGETVDLFKSGYEQGKDVVNTYLKDGITAGVMKSINTALSIPAEVMMHFTGVTPVLKTLEQNKDTKRVADVLNYVPEQINKEVDDRFKLPEAEIEKIQDEATRNKYKANLNAAKDLLKTTSQYAVFGELGKSLVTAKPLRITKLTDNIRSAFNNYEGDVLTKKLLKIQKTIAPEDMPNFYKALDLSAYETNKFDIADKVYSGDLNIVKGVQTAKKIDDYINMYNKISKDKTMQEEAGVLKSLIDETGVQYYVDKEGLIQRGEAPIQPQGQLPEWQQGIYEVDNAGNVKLVDVKKEGAYTPTDISKEELKQARKNIKTPPEGITDTQPYTYTPKNIRYEDITAKDIPSIQKLIELENAFNTARMTGQPFPLSNIYNTEVSGILDVTSGAVLDRLHQLTNAVKEYNNLAPETPKVNIPIKEGVPNGKISGEGEIRGGIPQGQETVQAPIEEGRTEAPAPNRVVQTPPNGEVEGAQPTGGRVAPEEVPIPEAPFDRRGAMTEDEYYAPIDRYVRNQNIEAPSMNLRHNVLEERYNTNRKWYQKRAQINTELIDDKAFNDLSPKHKMLGDYFQRLKDRGLIDDGQKELLKSIYKDTPPVNLEQLDRLNINNRLTRAIGQFKSISTGYFQELGRPFNLIEMASKPTWFKRYAVFLHEFGHYGWYRILTPTQRQLVETFYKNMGRKTLLDHFHIPESMVEKHATSSSHEFFAEDFARFMLRDKSTIPELRPIFENLYRTTIERSEGVLNKPNELAGYRVAEGEIASTYKAITDSYRKIISGEGVKLPKHFISDELLKKANDFLNRPPDITYTTPVGWYAKATEAYVIKGARLIEDGIRNFNEWSKRMIQEHGADIIPRLKELWGLANNYVSERVKEVAVVNADPKEQAKLFSKTEKGKNVKPTELQAELRKFLFDESIDPESMRELDTYRDENLPYVSKTRRKTLDFLRERYGIVVEKARASGGELLNRVIKGNGYKAKLLNLEKKYINNIYEIIDDPKLNLTQHEKVQIYTDVFKGALQDRANKDTYLKGDPVREKLYANAEDFYTTFKLEIDKAYKKQEASVELQRQRVADFTDNNYDPKVIAKEQKKLDMMEKDLANSPFKTIPDYATRMKVADLVSDIYDNAIDIDIKGKEKPPLYADFVSEKSPFLKERTGELEDIQIDMPKVMTTYMHSMVKNLAYRDAMEYYRYHFWDNLSPAEQQHFLSTGGADTIKQFLKDNMTPKLAGAKLNWLNKNIRNKMYRAFLWNNIKAASINYMQRQIIAQYMSPEAYKLTKQLYSDYKGKRIADDRILELLKDIDVETPSTLKYYEDIFEGGGFQKETWRKKFSEKMERADLFKKAEIGNWRFSQIGGIVKSVMDNPKTRMEYDRLISTGMKPMDAISELMKKPEQYEQALRQAVDLSSTTQVSPDPAYRPELYAIPAARTWAMFTRFPFQQLQILGRTLGNLEGSTGTRSLNILRRGMTEDITPVQVLQEVELTRKALQRAYDTEKLKPETKKVMDKYIDFLKNSEKELNNMIKKLEPMRGNKSAIARQWLKYGAEIYAISLAWQVLRNISRQQIDVTVPYAGRDEYDTLGQVLMTAFLDVQPLPFFQLNPRNFFQSPIMPNFEWSLFDNFNKRGALKSALIYAESMSPAYLPLYLLNRYSMNKLNDVVTEAIFPKEGERAPQDMTLMGLAKRYTGQESGSLGDLFKKVSDARDDALDDPTPERIAKYNELKHQYDMRKYESPEIKKLSYERTKKRITNEYILGKRYLPFTDVDSLNFEINWLLKQAEEEIQR